MSGMGDPWGMDGAWGKGGVRNSDLKTRYTRHLNVFEGRLTASTRPAMSGRQAGVC